MLPNGFTAGHWTDLQGGTGCTVLLAPEGTVASAEVRGGGPGTRETDLLSPAANAPGIQALLLTGGSAFGLAAADGVGAWLVERGRGYPTRAGLVPLVPAAVVYDLPFGDPAARPDAAAGRAACEAAVADPERGTVGAGTGCTVGKLLVAAAEDPMSAEWEDIGATKGGVGLASDRLGAATVTALAVVNAFGNVLSEDASVLAGTWRDGRWIGVEEMLRAGFAAPPTAREATTLVAIATDAALTKTEAWLVARAASAGVARAVDPVATAVDGDAVFCLASGEHPAHPIALSVLAAHVVSAAIRDAVRSATGLHGCPSASERVASAPRNE